MTSLPIGLLSLFCLCQTPAPEPIPGATLTNSIGIEFVSIQPGSLVMGESNPVIPDELGGPVPRGAGDGDERPLHQVTLTQPFWMARSEVTARQYQRFRPDHQNEGRYAPYVSGMSWNEADAFCRWLSDREGISYRLPTEAEWEYACRAGSANLFASGGIPPEHEAPNAWGLRNLQTGVAEYCLDWHGAYLAVPQTDPVGPEHGWTRIVRGGGIQEHGLHSEVGGWQPYYRRSANRAGVPMSYRGQHSIGIRLVQAPMPKSAPHPVEAVFAQQCIKVNLPEVATPPDGRIPHFKVRPLLPIPPDNMEPAGIAASGLAPELQGHNHSPGIAACANGDLLAVFFSATGSHAAEYWPNVGLIMSRLRYGAVDWDFPCPFLDVPDVNEGTAVIWNDGGVLHAFAGGVGMSDIPFKWSSSRDNGATWDGIKLPLLREPSGGYYPQPITPGFRDNQGTLYLPSDGLDATTLLWVSHDEGVTWSDPGGRTGGRHTAFALLLDGGILGMGGKNSNVDGYMPKSISHDGGKSYSVSKTPFAPLATNQRPSLVRLASGRLFFAGDYQSFDGKQPEGIHEHGCYAALSEDEGETWMIRKLPGTLPHESKTLALPKTWASNRHQEGTLGYSAACQSQDGRIHLITTMNHPCLHFELNEAWILAASGANTLSDSSGMASVGARMPQTENHPDGTLKATWSGIINKSGEYRLDGPETWYYPGGKKQWEVTWSEGSKVGSENYWSPEGNLEWNWDHHGGGLSVWTQWWPNGKKKSESAWKGGKCEGMATCWDHEGEPVSQAEFKEGAPIAH